MPRYLVLFAREPAREARAKGFFGGAGAELFAAFARGWADAARSAGARLILATPSEDRAAWGRWLPEAEEPIWLPQRGGSFGARVEAAAREADELGGRVVLVGGDVVPSPRGLQVVFRLLENGADAVVAPARDGGFSLVALRREDLDLLRGVAPRQSDSCARLCRRLLGRGRKVARTAVAPDVDRRRDLRVTLRFRLLSGGLLAAARVVLARLESFAACYFEALPWRRTSCGPGLRAPPLLRVS